MMGGLLIFVTVFHAPVHIGVLIYRSYTSVSERVRESERGRGKNFLKQGLIKPKSLNCGTRQSTHRITTHQTETHKT